MHKRNAKKITVGNIDDDLAMLCRIAIGWLRLLSKTWKLSRALYTKLEDVLGPEVILTSNTSTIP